MPLHVLAQESDHVSAAGVDRNKWKADGPVLLTTASHTAVSSQDSQGLALSRVRVGEGDQGGARNKSPPTRKAAPGGSSRKKAGAEREAQWDSTVVVKGKKEAERQLALQQHQGMARARAGGGRGADVFETTSDLWALEVSRDKQVCK
jgi:hypothetical protein